MIKVEDLSFSFEKTGVLTNISLHVKKGEFVGVIGPNGGGKTTFLKCLMGFLKPNKGKILINGNIGYVPQAQRVDKDFPITVGELVLMGALSQIDWLGRYPAKAKKRAKELMEELGLLGHEDKTFGSLSGGMAQKALLARTLLADPDILLLDEPTANIDASTTRIILEILQKLKGEKTILMVTHDLRTMVERVDKVLCIQGGLTSLLPEQICEHFALGLYHTPLLGLPEGHLNGEDCDALCLH